MCVYTVRYPFKVFDASSWPEISSTPSLLRPDSLSKEGRVDGKTAALFDAGSGVADPHNNGEMHTFSYLSADCRNIRALRYRKM